MGVSEFSHFLRLAPEFSFCAKRSKSASENWLKEFRFCGLFFNRGLSPVFMETSERRKVRERERRRQGEGEKFSVWSSPFDGNNNCTYDIGYEHEEGKKKRSCMTMSPTSTSQQKLAFTEKNYLEGNNNKSSRHQGQLKNSFLLRITKKIRKRRKKIVVRPKPEKMVFDEILRIFAALFRKPNKSFDFSA